MSRGKKVMAFAPGMGERSREKNWVVRIISRKQRMSSCLRREEGGGKGVEKGW